MRKIFAIAIVTLLGSTAFAAGEVYRWKDGNGIWHYSDQPQPGAELVRKPGVPAQPFTPPASVPAPAPSQAPVANDALPVSNEVAQQVRQDVATAKAKNCEKAKADYEKSVQSPRGYRLDEKGNRVFLSDAELDAARLQSRSNRDLLCGT